MVVVYAFASHARCEYHTCECEYHCQRSFLPLLQLLLIHDRLADGNDGRGAGDGQGAHEPVALRQPIRIKSNVCLYVYAYMYIHLVPHGAAL